MRCPKRSSVTAVLGSAPGGFEVVKPPSCGLGRIGVFDADVPTVALGTLSEFRLAMKRSPVYGAIVPSSRTVYLLPSSSFSVAVFCVASTLLPPPEV